MKSICGSMTTSATGVMSIPIFPFESAGLGGVGVSKGDEVNHFTRITIVYFPCRWFSVIFSAPPAAFLPTGGVVRHGVRVFDAHAVSAGVLFKNSQ
jgi:hypothetical protein